MNVAVSEKRLVKESHSAVFVTVYNVHRQERNVNFNKVWYTTAWQFTTSGCGWKLVADIQQKVIHRRAGLAGVDYLLPFKN